MDNFKRPHEAQKSDHAKFVGILRNFPLTLADVLGPTSEIQSPVTHSQC